MTGFPSRKRMFSNFCVLEKPKKFRNFQKKSPRWANINPQRILSESSARLSQGQPGSARVSLAQIKDFWPKSLPYSQKCIKSLPYSASERLGRRNPYLVRHAVNNLFNLCTRCVHGCSRFFDCCTIVPRRNNCALHLYLLYLENCDTSDILKITLRCGSPKQV